MSSQRFNALERVLSRSPIVVDPPADKVSDFYGESVFNDTAMREFLSDEVYEIVKGAIDKGEKIQRSVADQIAASMKAWSMVRGATHYTHWFLPLTGLTAEKHDAFVSPINGGKAIEKFEGDQLVQQEPDASSFPSGGIRNTFEARGYTAWDPSSPAFIIGKTLCIPTVFVSYTGEALDYKAPLLRALTALDKSAVEVCKYFDKNVNKVIATLGWEQEYFLIDSALYNARPDLVLTGRTVFGLSSSKDQQLDDHYFGSIPERAGAYIRDFENEMFRLGVPVTTRHNEVAPNQFECAPVYEEANLSVDHNQLLMDVMEKVARRHNFRVLMHEKPFAGINGSGKHNNWAMATNTGINLLQPGKNPKANLQFLTFFVNAIKAVNDHSDLMRAAIASAGNDFRLGANEAPPAIISVFIGEQLTKVLDEIEKKVKKGKMTPDEKTELKLGIGKIPEIMLDNTDRNRTSPFAFTGNKFEFRAVGSSANCASAMIVINTIVANQLAEFKIETDKIINAGVKKDEAIFQVLRNYIISSKKIRFEGNNYGEEWIEEAEKRGLSNIKSTPVALQAFTTKKNIDLFSKVGVLNETELYARREIKLENYTMKVQIESRIIADLAYNQIIPTAIKYQNVLIENVRGLKELGLLNVEKMESAKAISGSSDSVDVIEQAVTGNGYVPDSDTAFTQLGTIESISKHIASIKSFTDNMIEERKLANVIDDVQDKSVAYSDRVKPYFDKIRYHVDKLELIVDDQLWPLPKYRELLFTR
ncbi:MAG: glutamine synthetase type III [Bacteroidetes bacterium]|nr:MAG: glutamine synthetase type III [Bacteroidota bacterium]